MALILQLPMEKQAACAACDCTSVFWVAWDGACMPAATGGRSSLAATPSCPLPLEVRALLAGVAASGLPVNRFAAWVWRSRLTGTGVAAGDVAALAAGIAAAGVAPTAAPVFSPAAGVASATAAAQAAAARPALSAAAGVASAAAINEAVAAAAGVCTGVLCI